MSAAEGARSRWQLNVALVACLVFCAAVWTTGGSAVASLTT